MRAINRISACSSLGECAARLQIAIRSISLNVVEFGRFREFAGGDRLGMVDFAYTRPDCNHAEGQQGEEGCQEGKVRGTKANGSRR